MVLEAFYIVSGVIMTTVVDLKNYTVNKIVESLINIYT